MFETREFVMAILIGNKGCYVINLCTYIYINLNTCTSQYSASEIICLNVRRFQVVPLVRIRQLWHAWSSPAGLTDNRICIGDHL